MKQHTKTSMQEKPLQANGLRRLPNDAIGFDFCLITKMDGRKIKSKERKWRRFSCFR